MIEPFTIGIKILTINKSHTLCLSRSLLKVTIVGTVERLDSEFARRRQFILDIKIHNTTRHIGRSLSRIIVTIAKIAIQLQAVVEELGRKRHFELTGRSLLIRTRI